MIDWSQVAARVPLGTRVSVTTENLSDPDGLWLEEVEGVVMRFEDIEDGYNENFPEEAEYLDLVVWIQPFHLTSEWWIDPQGLVYFINGQWLTFAQVMGTAAAIISSYVPIEEADENGEAFG